MAYACRFRLARVHSKINLMGGDSFFREFDHTGDLGIIVEAPSRAELFARATIAMAWLMVERGGVRALERREIAVRADSNADRLHDLLAAALNLFMIDGFIWCNATAVENDGEVVAALLGECFDPARHQLITEIKAVTYHRLAIEHDRGGWHATVVFDI